MCLSNLRQLEVAHTLYMNDNREQFIDAGLGHGGLTLIERAWPVVLGEYAGPGMSLRSPVDASPFWPRSAGGVCDGQTLGEVLEAVETAAANGSTPGAVVECRWTSYGLNNFLTRFARPSVIDPRTGKFGGPWERLGKVPRPGATVHFLMMTQGLLEGSEEFAKSDHVHAQDWSEFGAELAPAYAATQMDVAAHGGPGSDGRGGASAESVSNYGFLDGHAATLRFKSVYGGPTDNAFWPEYAK